MLSKGWGILSQLTQYFYQQSSLPNKEKQGVIQSKLNKMFKYAFIALPALSKVSYNSIPSASWVIRPSNLFCLVSFFPLSVIHIPILFYLENWNSPITDLHRSTFNVIYFHLGISNSFITVQSHQFSAKCKSYILALSRFLFATWNKTTLPNMLLRGLH